MAGAECKYQPPLLQKPWRTINWDDKKKFLQYMNSLISENDVRIRVLLTGKTQAGKSSFINSVQSLLSGRISRQALSPLENARQKFKTYKFRSEGPEVYHPFVFSDTMGLSGYKGVLVEDIKKALMGHMKSGYLFDPDKKMDVEDEHYISFPTEDDKVHVVVSVIPAEDLRLVEDPILPKIKDIHRTACDLGIPQVVILTKIDESYQEIQDDLRNVYRVDGLKSEVKQLSAELGIPMNCIFPVKNYHEEIDTNSLVDSQILSVLKMIISFGQDHINFQKSQS